MTLEVQQRPLNAVSIELPDYWPLATGHSRTRVALGLGVVVSLVLVGLTIFAWAFAFHAVNAAMSGGSQGETTIASEVTQAGLQNPTQQAVLVERQRAAILAHVARRAEFDVARARIPDEWASGFRAAEAKRTDYVLTGLVLACIDAVQQYNLAAQALTASQLRSAGLPESFVWAVDCSVSS